MGKPRKSYSLWIAGRIVRLLLVLVVFGVCALLCWRVFISNIPPSSMEELTPNVPLVNAYTASGGNLTLFTQEEGTVTRGENNSGYFGISRCVFIPEAQQIQLVIRYNNSTLEAIQQDKKLADEPPKGVKILDVTLSKMVDLTPEDLTDNVDGSETVAQQRLFPTGEPIIDTTLLYTYCLYTFDNVTVDDAIAIFTDFYYLGDVNYEAAPYGTLRIYHTQSPKLPLSLSDDEREILSNYGK